MARARNIKPSIMKNELLGEADPMLYIVFTGLWMLADREGRLEDRPKRIKAEICPFRDTVTLPLFNGYLTELASLGFIHRYTVENQAVIQVVNFSEHQSPHKTEKPSKLPPPPAESAENKEVTKCTVNAPLNNGNLTEVLPPDLLIPDLLIPDLLTEDSGADLDDESPLEAAPPESPPQEPDVSEFGQPKPNPANHPALIAVRSLTGTQPDRVLWEKLQDILGAEPDPAKLHISYVEWRSRGYKPTNYGWVTDWYVNGIPDKEQKKHGASKQPSQLSAETARRIGL